MVVFLTNEALSFIGYALMSKFFINEGHLELPANWEDRTVNGLSFPAGSKQPQFSVAITRDNAKPPEMSLAAYVDRHLHQMAKDCSRFDLLSREDTVADGVPAIRVAFTWRPPDGNFVQQEQTILVLDTGTVLTFTGTALKSRYASFSQIVRELVATFQLRSGR